MARHYNSSYYAIKHNVSTQSWDSLKIGFGPLNAAGFSLEDVAQNTLKEVFGTDLDRRKLYKVNQFISSWNKLRALDPTRQLPELTPFPNQWDLRETKRLTLLSPGFLTTVDLFVASLPVGDRVGLRNAICDRAVTLRETRPQETTNLKLQDLLLEDNLLTILDSFGPHSDASPLRTSTITWMRKLADFTNVSVNFKAIFEAYARKNTFISNEIIGKLSFYYELENFHSECKKALQTVIKFASVVELENTELALAQCGLIWLISVFQLVDYEELRHLRFEGPLRTMNGGGERPHLTDGHMICEDQWPNQLQNTVDLFWRTTMRLLNAPPIALMIDKRGKIRRSLIGKNIFQTFGCTLNASQFRLIGITIALIEGVSIDEIARSAGNEKDYFERYFRPLIADIARLRADI